MLKECFFTPSIIGRIRGDEFVVLTSQQNDIELTSFRLQNAIQALYSHRRFLIFVSVGTAVYDPEQPCSLDELVASADTWMYQEKQRKQVDHHIHMSMKELKTSEE